MSKDLYKRSSKIWSKKIKVGLLKKAQLIKQKQKKEFWKISEWNNDLCGYVVKHCSLTKEKAKELNEQLTRQGRYVRISPHFEKKIVRRKK